MISRVWVRIRCVAGVLLVVLTGAAFMMTRAEWKGIWSMFRTGVPVPRPEKASPDRQCCGYHSEGGDTYADCWHPPTNEGER